MIAVQLELTAAIVDQLDGVIPNSIFENEFTHRNVFMGILQDLIRRKVRCDASQLISLHLVAIQGQIHVGFLLEIDDQELLDGSRVFAVGRDQNADVQLIGQVQREEIHALSNLKNRRINQFEGKRRRKVRIECQVSVAFSSRGEINCAQRTEGNIRLSTSRDVDRFGQFLIDSQRLKAFENNAFLSLAEHSDTDDVLEFQSQRFGKDHRLPVPSQLQWSDDEMFVVAVVVGSGIGDEDRRSAE